MKKLNNFILVPLSVSFANLNFSQKKDYKSGKKIEYFDRIYCRLEVVKNNLFQLSVFTGLLFLMTLCFVPVIKAQSDFVSFLNRSDFNAVSSNLSIIDFESATPATKRGFAKYPVAEGLTVNRVSFRTSGGARFGPGMILVLSADYASFNPMTNLGTGAMLDWAVPNQPGNAHLDVTLPDGVYAVGADLWTGQPYVSTVDVTAATGDGKTLNLTVGTQKRPHISFAGFVSDKEIVSVRFTLPKGQTRLFLDNFSYGRKREGANLKLSNSATVQPRDDKQNTNQAETPVARPTVSPEKSIPKSLAADPDAPREQSNNPTLTSNKNSVSTTAAGNIAYVRGSKEIRLIAPDGANDRRILAYADATNVSGINELAWRPDGKEIAFSSGHDEIFSIYDADIYAIKPDGTGLRKLTNAPDRSELARLPKGSVSVTVRNTQPLYQQSQASTGIFIIYVAGADEPQQILLPPGASKTLVFKSVADFGKQMQPIVAIQGGNRWVTPGTDVQAGRAVKAPDFGITGDGIPLLGAFRPVWRNDGSRISYRSGLCVISTASANSPVIGHTFNPLFGENPPSQTCAWDWGPTAVTANQIIYGAGQDNNWSIYRMTEGGKHPGEKLKSFTADEYQFLEDLRWLPDGSGFVFSSSELLQGAGNIYKYDLATKQTTRVTDFTEDFAGAFSISPDGKWIVFERKKSRDDEMVDLWLVGTDGRNLKMLVKNGSNPAWSR